ncbi:hypothetical protein [Glutamicibacter endophyticus]|uniref:hypothetical protein n=1 Tax=Glutamicibacter endophyticus TaxID=1522174 RepID=UPI003AF0BB2C
MRNSFNARYVLAVVSAGIAYFALALAAYLSGVTSLLFIGLGLFLAVVLTMSTLAGLRQQRARAEVAS